MYTLFIEFNVHGYPFIRDWHLLWSISDWHVCLSVSAGRLGLLDYDEVELSNLHRQVLHGEENRGQAKALSAASAVKRYWKTVHRGPKHFNISIIQKYKRAFEKCAPADRPETEKLVFWCY